MTKEFRYFSYLKLDSSVLRPTENEKLRFSMRYAAFVQPSPLSRNYTYPEWGKGLEKSLWTPHIQHTPLWSTLQSSEHQNDQTQEQVLPSGNPSHEHLTLNMEHTTLLYIIYSSHILIYISNLHISYLYIDNCLYYMLCFVLGFFSFLFFVHCLFCIFVYYYFVMCPVLLPSFCCTVELLSL